MRRECIRSGAATSHVCRRAASLAVQTALARRRPAKRRDRRTSSPRVEYLVAIADACEQAERQQPAARETPRPQDLEPRCRHVIAIVDGALSSTGRRGAPRREATRRRTGSAADRSRHRATSGARSQPPRAGKALDRLELDTTQITGNRELPKVLYIVPWKRTDLGDLVGKPVNSLLDEVLTPVDRDVFQRENRYYRALTPGAVEERRAVGAGRPAPTPAAQPSAHQQCARGGKPRLCRRSRSTAVSTGSGTAASPHSG